MSSKKLWAINPLQGEWIPRIWKPNETQLDCCPFKHAAETELRDEVAFIKEIINITKWKDIDNIEMIICSAMHHSIVQNMIKQIIMKQIHQALINPTGN